MVIEYFHNSTQISAIKSVATIGVFDGVHRGHQYLLKQVIENARKKHYLATVVTFTHHPQSILSPDPDSIKLLTTLEERMDIFKTLGIDKLILCNFNREFSLIPASDFLRTLIRSFHIDKFILGVNHTFGYQKSGNIHTFPILSQELNIDIQCIPPFLEGDTPISSSYIRKLLLQQNVETAELLLGRAYSITGYVIKGEQRGKSLGFPTANVQVVPPNRLVPSDGVYCGYVKIEGKQEFPALISIGNRSTFGNLPKAIEAYLINFSENLYGKEIRLFFKKFIRDQIKFQNSNELILKMKEDERFAYSYFGLN